MCEYRDPETPRLAEKKGKLIPRNEDCTTAEHFIIPLSDKKRCLFMKPETEERERKIWNLET